MTQMNKNIYSFSDIKNIYNSQYLFNIFQLLTKTNYTFNFLTVEDMLLIEDDLNKPLLNKDSFLQTWDKDKLFLAKDILSKGTYWPFIVTKNNEVIEGRHRLYSLKLYDKYYKKIPIKFLCIKMPWDLNEWYNLNFLMNNVDLSTPVKYYKLNENPLALNKESTNNSCLIYQSLYKISNILLNNAIFVINKKYKNFILPNPLLNNEELFNDFLKRGVKNNTTGYKT